MRRVLAVLTGVVLLAGSWWFWQRAQWADPQFDARVSHPAYEAGTGPRVCVDHAHHNLGGIDGRYGPFADLLRNDGYTVISSQAAFAPGWLAACHTMVVANALGSRWRFLPAARRSPFSESETEALTAWVWQGGSLLLVTDHEPAGGAAAPLAARFSVVMSGGFAYDDPHSDWTSGSPSWLVFQRDTGARVLDHPITRGRDSGEFIRRVVTFTGQSLRGPPGSSGFLELAAGARDRLRSGQEADAAGKSQAVSLVFGAGRVVVLGEAAMLTAQVTGGGRRRFGMNWPNTDDRQLTLNILHWLSGRLSEQ